MIPLRMKPWAHRISGRISVVLPSRKRPDMLKRSLQSLYDNLYSPSYRIEILVAHDPDDPATAGTVKGVASHSYFPHAFTWQSPGRYGYGGIANYYVPLLEMSRGEWILFWGDDAIMKTRGWDRIVREHKDPVVMYTMGNPDGHNCFPIVHSAILQTLGRFTGLPAVDTWYDEVGRWSGRWADPEIEILQDRPDLTGKAPDATYNEGRSGYRAAEYYNPYWTMMRKEDARAVFEHFGALGARSPKAARLEPVTDVRKTMDRFGFAGFDDILKHPWDLVRYERIIQEDKPEVIVETGTRNGASARWYASLGVDVITVDIDLSHVPTDWGTRPQDSRITLIEGSSTDVSVYKKVVDLVGDRQCMVSLDSDHTRDHVLSEIIMYADLVSPGCHLVVEDGIFRYAMPREWAAFSFGDITKGNPLDAIEDSLLMDSEEWKRDIEIEAEAPITHHVGGWWKRA